MLFAILDWTKAKLKNFDTLSDKDREPNEKHGLQMAFSNITKPASDMEMLDPTLRAFLLEMRDDKKQGDLAGMESEVLTKAGSYIGTISWQQEWTGYTLIIDYGAGGKSNIELTDCKVHGLKFKPKDGSMEITRLIIESPNATEKIIGKVGVLKSTEVTIKLLPPVVTQEDLVGQPPAQQPKKPNKSGEASKAALDASGKNPFPQQTPEQALAATSTVQ